MPTSQIDLDRLLQPRLVVARFDEMDLARCWNTKGQPGRLGTAAFRRGFLASTSPAIESALKSVLEAPSGGGTGNKTRKGKASA